MGQFQTYTLPAFPGGINKISSIDQVPETDAVDLLNVFPGTRLELRRGIDTVWTASDGDSNKTLANLVESDGTETLVAAADNDLLIKNGTSSASIKGAASITLDEWQHTTFNNILFLVNGTDTPLSYTGTGNVSALSFTGGSTPTLSTLINVTSYKQSLYFVAKNSTSIWYGNFKAVGTTALTEFPVGYFLKLGGRVISCGSWTNNFSVTSQDLFYILSSEGELLFFQGLYPGDTSWSLVARYSIGRPLGYRAHLHVENDLWFITDRGIFPVSALFQGGSAVAGESISRKVNPIIRAAASSFPFSYIYSGVYNAIERKVYINLPITSTGSKQLVLNLETGAWTIYQYAVSGAALTLAMSDGVLYLGAKSGKIYKAETGYDDDDLSIPFRIRGGFNFFGRRGLFKAFKDIRPIIRTSAGVFTLKLDVDTDFRQLNSYATITTPDIETENTSVWDDAAWDTSPWSDEDRYLFSRYSLKGQGHCGALRIEGNMKDALLEFNAFEIRFEEGAQT